MHTYFDTDATFRDSVISNQRAILQSLTKGSDRNFGNELYDWKLPPEGTRPAGDIADTFANVDRLVQRRKEAVANELAIKRRHQKAAQDDHTASVNAVLNGKATPKATAETVERELETAVRATNAIQTALYEAARLAVDAIANDGLAWLQDADDIRDSAVQRYIEAIGLMFQARQDVQVAERLPSWLRALSEGRAENFFHRIGEIGGWEQDRMEQALIADAQSFCPVSKDGE